MNIKKIKFKKVVYPVIFTAFIIAVIIFFIYSVKFLADAVDKAFVLDANSAESRMIKLDLDGFNLAARKLGITIGQERVTSNEESVIENQQTATTTNETNTANEANKLDKTAVKIEILNSTKTAGLAGELKNILEADGFKIEKTGNTSPIRETTLIQTKESKNDYLPLIKESVSKKYQASEDKSLVEGDIYDIIIIIGTK